MEHWRQVKIGDVCVVERGSSPRPIEKYITESESGINWIKIGDTTESMYITSTAQKIIPEGIKKSRTVQAGDFLLSNSMSFGRPYILKIDGCIHDGWLVLRDTDNLFDKHFLYYSLSSPITYHKFKSMAVGGVVNNLNSEMVRNVVLSLPPLDEQRKIAAVLDKVSDLIAKRRQQLDKLDLLVKSKFVEMFGELEDNEKKYSIKKLGELTNKISDGVHSKPVYTDTGRPFLSVLNINKGVIDFKSCKFVSEEAYQKMIKSTKPERGDILYTKVGATYGIPAYVDTDIEFCLYVSVCLIKPKHEEINSKFLALSMAMPYIKRQADRRIKGIGVPDLHLNQIREFDVLCPPCSEQERYVAFVEQVDKSKSTIQQSLNKLETLKKALMQEYFG